MTSPGTFVGCTIGNGSFQEVTTVHSSQGHDLRLYAVLSRHLVWFVPLPAVSRTVAYPAIITCRTICAYFVVGQVVRMCQLILILLV